MCNSSISLGRGACTAECVGEGTSGFMMCDSLIFYAIEYGQTDVMSKISDRWSDSINGEWFP